MLNPIVDGTSVGLFQAVAAGRGKSFDGIIHSPFGPLPGRHANSPRRYRAGDDAVTILLVEDEPTVREMVKMYLEGNGYNVIEAADADRALELWHDRDCEIDLVLTDVMMPGLLNGPQLVQELQAERPELKAILVSGYGPDSFQDVTFPFGTTNFLQKPYRLIQLVEAIRDCLGATSVT